MECLAKVEHLQTRLELLKRTMPSVRRISRLESQLHRGQHPGRRAFAGLEEPADESPPGRSGIAAIVVVRPWPASRSPRAMSKLTATALSGVLGGIVLPQPHKGRPGRAVSLFSSDGRTLFVGQPSPCWHRCAGLLHQTSRQAVRFRIQFDVQYQVGHSTAVPAASTSSYSRNATSQRLLQDHSQCDAAVHSCASERVRHRPGPCRRISRGPGSEPSRHQSIRRPMLFSCCIRSVRTVHHSLYRSS